MASTPNYNFTLPTIGGDQNSWGNELNANWSSLDTLLHNAASSTGSFLPLTGGIISGSLAVQGAIQANATLGVKGLCAFGFPTVNDFYMILGDPNAGPNTRVLQWAANAKLDFDPNYGSFAFWRSGTALLSIDSGGTLAISGATAYKVGGSSSWTVTSDDRTKRHVEPYRSGLDEICLLWPISFEYNGEGGTSDDGRRHIGLSAQATRGVLPELVREMPSGYLGLDLGPLALTLVNAVRELADRLAALEHAA